MNPFYKYLDNLLTEHLKKYRVLVWYDPKTEFLPFVDSLPAKGSGENDLALVTIGGMDVSLSRFQGSFFEIKDTVDPLVAADLPGPLVLYVPGVNRDKEGSVLMELEKGGYCFEWKLKSQARFCLREKFTDGVIDEMLAPENVTYEDIVAFLAESGAEKPSVLRTVFNGIKDNPSLIAFFISNSSLDEKIIQKDAMQELCRLVESRLGLAIEPETPLSEVRQKVLRFVLVNEFCSDLLCDPPVGVTMIPKYQTRDQLDLVRKIAMVMREQHPDTYASLSDSVAMKMDLSARDIDPACLGRVDTFRFEETALLSLAGEWVRKGKYEEALKLVSQRKRSFWVDRSLLRQSQWELCRRTARMGVRMVEVRSQLRNSADAPSAWVNKYCAQDGWYRLDQAQHAMEAWVAKMEEDPENEAALEMVRRDYEDLLQEMTQGFIESLSGNNWIVGDVMSQTQIFSAVIKQEKTATTFFMVDAMRYAMAADLVNLLSGARDTVLKPAVGAWPTVTTVGMAALLPGAEKGFCIVDEKGKLAARVEDAVLPNVAGRMKYLKSRVPGAVEMQLEKLLEMSSKKLGKTISQAPLVVVRSQEIDALGELAGGLVARQLMDTMVGNVARAVKKLAAAGIQRFVIAADHGHLFTRKKEDAFKTDPPGGKTLEIHRRCWVGHGGATPPGTVRLSGTQVGYDTDLEFVFPKGIGVFKTGGDLSYHHGGLSLQEMMIPVLTFKMGKTKAPGGAEGEVQLLGEPDELANRTFGIQLALGGLFDVKPFVVRPLLLSKGVVVGKAGMAMDADFDPEKGDVTLYPDKKAVVGMILELDDADKVRVVIQDPATDRVLAQSKDIHVKLGTK